MATPIAFPDATLVVNGVPVRRLGDVFVSCWRFSLPEIEEIIRTGEVYAIGDVRAPTLVTGHKAEVI